MIFEIISDLMITINVYYFSDLLLIFFLSFYPILTILEAPACTYSLRRTAAGSRQQRRRGVKQAAEAEGE